MLAARLWWYRYKMKASGQVVIHRTVAGIALPNLSSVVLCLVIFRSLLILMIMPWRYGQRRNQGLTKFGLNAIHRAMAGAGLKFLLLPMPSIHALRLMPTAMRLRCGNRVIAPVTTSEPASSNEKPLLTFLKKTV